MIHFGAFGVYRGERKRERDIECNRALKKLVCGLIKLCGKGR